MRRFNCIGLFRALRWRIALLKYTLLLLCAVAGAIPSARAAMEIQGLVNGTAPATNYDRFDNAPNFIGNPANWSAGPPAVNNPFPWVGVGRGEQGRWGTLISPSYIISASHYPPSGNIRFYDTNDPNGPYEVRTIVASEWLSVTVPGDDSDIWIGKLNQPVSSADVYPILTLPQASDYQGLTIDTFGMSDVPAGVGSDGNATTERLGRNVISWATATSYSSGTPPTNGPYQFNYTYSNPGIGNDESYLMPGDSGGPSFFLYGGAKPALVGVHWFTSTTGMGTPYSADSFLSPYVGDIQTGMNQLATLTATAPETLTTETPIKGDFNLDGRLSNADISAMMVALTNVSSYETLHGMNTAYLNYIGDINGDGLVNNADLQALLTLFKSGTVATGIVPEPAAWLPLMLGGVGLLAWQVLARRK